ncbi:hypothetical protein [Synechococcus phage BUCT-ZZ01]|nr:hypothetical protein [Synechococcus phage BUCT-ZZ01]
MSYVEGSKLNNNQSSKTGLYGIRSTKSNVMLRITMFKEAACEMRDDSREIVEVGIKI